MDKILTRLATLLEVKSLVTLTMTAVLSYLLCANISINSDLLALFSGVYGSVITYFFTRKSGNNHDQQQ